MGRLESLTALALGRGHYEDEVIIDSDRRAAEGSRSQQYNDRGYPKNSETKRREREQVRAANEVMQVTGVVEDSIAAKAKVAEFITKKNQETLNGLRLMEVGRATLVGGVWGVLGLRRRILLYKPYAEARFLEIIKGEASTASLSRLVFAGLPTVIAYHVSDYVGFFAETVLDAILDEDNDILSPRQLYLKWVMERLLDIGFCYITLHFRMFAVLQQINLIPSSRLLPSPRSFIPFSATSPLQLPPRPSPNPRSIALCGLALARTAAPMMVILAHGKVKYFFSQIIYRPIYKSLPRPTGDSIFSGMAITPPTMEYDSPDLDTEGREYRGEDEPTLRALEGLPALDRHEYQSRQNDGEQDVTDDDDDEMTQETLISFDVEATEAVESSRGTWSAELRSANEPKQSDDIKYRVTGLTMLPTILATEGLREVVAGAMVMPLEAVMVRIIGRAYRESAGLGMEDMYSVTPAIRGFGNVFSALAIQLVATGVMWAGFTIGIHLWGLRAQVQQLILALAKRLWGRMRRAKALLLYYL